MTQPKRLTSQQNAQFKRWKSLLEAKGIRSHQQGLVSGEKIVLETLARHPERCREILGAGGSGSTINVPAHVSHYLLSQELFDKLDVLGTHFPLLVINIHPIPTIDLSRPPIGLELICPLGDPSNVGTIVRSSLAFGVHTLILLKEAAYPFHPKAIRASCGAVFDQHLSRGPSIADLDDEKFLRWIVALDLTGDNLASWRWPQDIRLLVGQEGLGQPAHSFIRKLTILQTSDVNSLNAAAAASIALFSYRQEHPIENTTKRAGSSGKLKASDRQI